MMYRPWSLEGDRIEGGEVVPPHSDHEYRDRVAARPRAERRGAHLHSFCRIELESGRLEARRHMPIERE